MGLTSQLNRYYRKQIKAGNYPICYLCGLPITRQSEVSQDHIQSKSNGGKTTEANLACTHKLCNSHKGSMTVQKWFDLQAQRQRT